MKYLSHLAGRPLPLLGGVVCVKLGVVVAQAQHAHVVDGAHRVAALLRVHGVAVPVVDEGDFRLVGCRHLGFCLYVFLGGGIKMSEKLSGQRL